MSHLTASPFHKPSAFEFPQRVGVDALPSVPQLPTPASIPGGGDLHSAEYFETPAASISPENPGSRFRRVASSIGYHNSSLRESRERTVQRSSRTFVVVLPPPSLPQDHGHLGHTLSSGPRHRLSQGLLMPLFPTMYGQLTAIAREYNFPSTTGVCLYLHFTDHGITATPRISDDSWQMIWSHAFDPAPSNSVHSSLPISGKIEFDIDLRLARWYGSWMASSHREHVDVPMSVTPSAAPSVIHYREESRTTFADADDQDSHSVARAPARHVPRKLSLIDRFDAMSARSVPRSVVNRAPPLEGLPGSQNLSPIFQEDEPKTAKYDLEHRVNSWRASASVLPQALTEAGHILAANLPSSPLDESPMPSNEEDVRLEDYAFSVSSAGPGDYDPYSPLTLYYDPSVHLAHRLQGSVCMTPSDCTSFGPSDYTLPSPVPSLDGRVHTPDIANRMFEDVPPSPSVATSWGAPLSYPPSPISHYRAPSVDLGDRQCFSRPMTPMTATSWGAPMSFPPSPTTPYHVHTPDAGQRAFDLSAFSDHDGPWSFVWPYHNTSGPWSQVWPYNNSYRITAEVETGNNSQSGPWNMVWPFTSDEEISQRPTVVYPHFDLYPTTSGAINDIGSRAAIENRMGPVTIRLAATYPIFDLYPATYPGNLDMMYPVEAINAPSEISTRLSPRYPLFDLYPAVYPNVVPYPPFQHEMEALSNPVSLSASHYPNINPYPSIAALAQPVQISSVVYPHFDLYPAVSLPLRGPVSVVLRTVYPVFNLYPAVYPVFDIYPGIEGGSRAESANGDSLSVRINASYPIFILYPAVYPVFDLYPALPEDCYESPSSKVPSVSYPYFNIYPDVSHRPYNTAIKLSQPMESAPISTRLQVLYPIFDLYPVIYPALEFYPYYPEDCAPGSREGSGVSVRLTLSYPVFDLYPAVYPVFEIYPALPEDCALRSREGLGVSVRLTVSYPNFDLYPAVYPAFEIYPTLPEDCALGSSRSSGAPVRPTVAYPIFDLYPAVYPAFDIYPSLPDDCAASQMYTSYGENGYPHFNLYPPVRGSSVAVKGRNLELDCHLAQYPIFNLYPAVYPYFDLYPEVSRTSVHAQAGAVSRYPVFNLYPAVYPFFDLYPSIWRGPDERDVDIQVEASYPYFNLYPAIYPHFDLWPAISSMEAPRIPKQSRFTRSDLHTMVKMQSQFDRQRRVHGSYKTHHALHLAVFPNGVDVTTPSRTGILTDDSLTHRLNIRVPSKTHHDLHISVFPNGDVSTPSGTSIFPGALSVSGRPSPRLQTRVSVRMSLPPSPRPVGGRSPTVRNPTNPTDTTLVAPPRRILSTTTRLSVVERVAHSGHTSLNRSASVASPPSSIPEPGRLDRAASVGGPRASPRRRDSLVLQRVRALQSNTEPIQEDDPLANFPLPPRISVAATRKPVVSYSQSFQRLNIT